MQRAAQSQARGVHRGSIFHDGPDGEGLARKQPRGPPRVSLQVELDGSVVQQRRPLQNPSFAQWAAKFVNAWTRPGSTSRHFSSTFTASSCRPTVTSAAPKLLRLARAPVPTSKRPRALDGQLRQAPLVVDGCPIHSSLEAIACR